MMNIKARLKSVMEECGLPGIRGALLLPVCCFTSLFFLYTAYFGIFPSLIQRTVLLLCCSLLVFLSKPASVKHPRISALVDTLFVLAALVGFGYTFFERTNIEMFVGLPRPQDFVFGILCIICVVEGTRRKVGWALPIVAAVFFLYGVLGPFLPGLLRHGGMDSDALITALYMSEEGIFGVPTMAVANFVFAFILFGAFLQVSGAGEAFTNIALAAFGHMRGGPAKASVVSSSLIALLSGSAVANVVTTGPFTIPLMKKSGYSDSSAGAIEAVASTGGQIMPPIMGAAAFIMADILGVPYLEIIRAAIIPAILYYVALFFMVHAEAAKMNLQGVKVQIEGNIKKLLLGSWYAFLPIFTLVYFLGIARLSPQRSVFYAIAIVFIASMFRKHTRITPVKFLKALVSGAKTGMEVGIVVGCVGIVISIVLRSGLGLRLTTLLIELSGGILIVLLILTMLASFIIGMGLPTSAAYIIVAILIAPAMVRLGIPPIAAHLFVFYFACLSAITPPVALASFAAASLAEAPPMITCWKAVRYGLCGFIVPYMFVFGTPLIFVGTVPEIVLAFITACIGAYLLAIGLMGFQFMKVSLIFQFLFAACALLLIIPGWATDIVGLLGGIGLSALNYRNSKRQIPSVA